VWPGPIVFDVGANISAYTVLFAHWFGATGRVVAFEPSPGRSRGCVSGCVRNAWRSSRPLFRRAGTAAFDCGGASGANALVPDAEPGAHVIRVETTSLDAFCAARGMHPSIVKIDVEGAELDALRGARETLARPDVDAFVEFHPSVWKTRGITRGDIESELMRQRLTPEPLHPSIDIWTTEGSR
jgi:FkbM family methyltransferase